MNVPQNQASNKDVHLTDNPRQAIPPDLFADPAHWLADPVSAFSAWISHESVASSTKIVRIAMWNKFMRWLDGEEGEGVSLDACRAKHITRFLADSGLDKEQAWRYVKLIERVFIYLNKQGLKVANPGREAVKEGIGNKDNAPARFLNPWERERLVKVIEEILTPAGDTEALVRFENMKKGEKDKIWAKCGMQPSLR